MTRAFAILVAISACADESPQGAAADADLPIQECDEKSVLFVGNSYTFDNDLPQTVAALAVAHGCPYQIDQATVPGASFESHLADSATLNKIESQAWDVVVLQNQSQRPGFRPADVLTRSLPMAEGLVRHVRSNHDDTHIAYFATWGRRDGDVDNCDYHPAVCTFEGHTAALADGYALYEDATGDSIAAAGGGLVGRLCVGGTSVCRVRFMGRRWESPQSDRILLGGAGTLPTHRGPRSHRRRRGRWRQRDRENVPPGYCHRTTSVSICCRSDSCGRRHGVEVTNSKTQTNSGARRVNRSADAGWWRPRKPERWLKPLLPVGRKQPPRAALGPSTAKPTRGAPPSHSAAAESEMSPDTQRVNVRFTDFWAARFGSIFASRPREVT